MNQTRKQAAALLLSAAGLVVLLAACTAILPAAHISEIPAFKFLSTTKGDLELPTASRQQSSSQVLDVDRDGLNDIVIGSRLDPGPYLVWYRRGVEGWQRYLIEDQPISMSPSGTYSDIDSDGDLDIVMGGSSDSSLIWWWENPYPHYDPQSAWTRYTIKTEGETKHHDMLAADFDQDGRPELAFWNQYARVLNIARLPADPKSLDTWPLTPIFTWEGSIKLEGLEAADIDGDGWVDLVGGGRWFKNNAGEDFSAHPIDLAFEYGRVAVGQLVSGGWPEVVFSIGDDAGRLKWYEWKGSAWLAHDLGEVDHAHSLQLVDINQDGNLDIFTAEMRLDGENEDSGMWFLLGNSRGQFQRASVASGYDNHENRVADLDGDGDLDILGKPFNHDTPALNIWINEGTTRLALDTWERHVVDDARPWRALFITAQDVNGDQYTDILTGGWWYQNPGPAQGSWQRQVFGEGLNNLAAVYDFDGDGDVDVLGTQGQGSDPNNTFVWARNDGQGGFSIHHNIQPGEGTFLQGVAVDHFSGDGLGVVLSWHNDEAEIELIHVPADPLTQEWTVQNLSPLTQSEGIASGDIDRDGQVDLLLGRIWLSNAGGQWHDHQVVDAENEPDRNLLADINADGRLDAVLGFEAKSQIGKLAWYEQPAEHSGKWVEHLIANPPIIAPMSVSVADMDGDGDLDVIAGEHNTEHPERAGLFIFENLDGRGARWQKHTVSVGDEHHVGAQVIDIDRDGDLDVLSIGWNHANVLLYENLAAGSPAARHP